MNIRGDSHNPYIPKSQGLHHSRILEGQNCSQHTVDAIVYPLILTPQADLLSHYRFYWYCLRNEGLIWREILVSFSNKVTCTQT